MKKKKVTRAFDNSYSSNVARSSRRFVFNHQNDPSAEKFHSDNMYGSGSGILLKLHDTYFVLTAKHVLDIWAPLEEDGYQNDSPFWVHNFSQGPSIGFKIEDFLYPRRVWDISELMKFQAHHVDGEDIILIEMFHPPHYHQPDHFLDFDKGVKIVRKDQFFPGQFLIVSGYPDRSNGFFYDNPPVGFTHETTFHRSLICGVLLRDDGDYISLEFCDEPNFEHDALVGMSGGIVCNVEQKRNAVRFAGMVLTGSNNKVRFLPAWAIEEALKNYQKCTCWNADPRADGPLSRSEFEEYLKYLSEYERRNNPKYLER